MNELRPLEDIQARLAIFNDRDHSQDRPRAAWSLAADVEPLLAALTAAQEEARAAKLAMHEHGVATLAAMQREINRLQDERDAALRNLAQSMERERLTEHERDEACAELAATRTALTEIERLCDDWRRKTPNSDWIWTGNIERIIRAALAAVKETD